MIWHFLAIIVGAAAIACGFNWFLIPHQLLSGGVSGISMLLGYFTALNLSVMYFVLNIPLLIAGWFILGRRFIILSIVSVLATSWFIGFLPIITVADDPLLSCVFGEFWSDWEQAFHSGLAARPAVLTLSARSLPAIAIFRSEP